ncbi:hypothetical protein N2152v2_008075 [Parachlorella kessleri]
MSRQDPAAVLGRDVMHVVLGNLPARDLAVAGCVSKQWQSLCSEGFLWRRICEDLWHGKVYVPQAAAGSELSWRQRYEASLLDAARNDITTQELCTFSWTFRFKWLAGVFWTAQDPYWTREGHMLRRFFHESGSLTAAPSDPFWGHHECRWRFTKSKEGLRGHYVKVNHWPSLSISRTPSWGWRMENCWVVYEAELRPGGPYAAGPEGAAPPHQA